MTETTTPDSQHELVLALADELVRMEQNLNRMDGDTKGRKQLLRSVERMKTAMMAAGYEVDSLLGHTYEEGMRVVATFVIDDSLPPQAPPVITAVSRPQVIFQGQLVQAAQVTVSQGL